MNVHCAGVGSQNMVLESKKEISPVKPSLPFYILLSFIMSLLCQASFHSTMITYNRPRSVYIYILSEMKEKYLCGDDINCST